MKAQQLHDVFFCGCNDRPDAVVHAENQGAAWPEADEPHRADNRKTSDIFEVDIDNM